MPSRVRTTADRVTALSSGMPEDLRRGYRAMRVLALAQPFHPVEQAAERQVASAMTSCLGLPLSEAAHQARRWVLYRRELLLHEILIIETPAPLLAQLVDAVHLPSLAHQTGTILISLHYSLYSSLLWLRLTREAALGRCAPVTVVFDSGQDGRWRFPRLRPAELERESLMDSKTARLLDIGQRGRVSAARTLARRLRLGENVVILFDPPIEEQSGKRDTHINVGRGRIKLPAGPATIAAAANASMRPLWIEPEADGYAIRLGARSKAGAPRPPNVQAIAQSLLDVTAIMQPALWEGWVRFRELAAS